MTIEDREILLANCEVLKAVVECQMDTHKAYRSLFLALEKHFPDLRKEVDEARKETAFVNDSAVELHRLQQKIQGIIERLKHPAA